MRDLVVVDQLVVAASIGVFDWEKKILQSVMISLELEHDCERAGQTDDLADALDYAAVCHSVQQVANRAHFELLESLAACIIDHLFNAYPALQGVRIRIDKPGAVPAARSVAIILYRSRRPE